MTTATNVVASDGLSGKVTITATLPAGTKSIQVWRSSTQGQAGTQIAQVPSLPYDDTTAQPGITSFYGLKIQGRSGPFGPLSAQDSGFAAALTPPLTITTSSLDAAQVGVVCSDTLSATGGNAPYAWSVGSGSLPAGVTLSQSGTISGTPTTQGSFAFSVRVVDSASQSATKPLSIDVAAATVTNSPPVWQTIPPLNFTFGTPSSVSVAQYASDPDGNPLTFTLETGPIPSGITFDPVNATFNYNGGGAAISVTGITVGADDGK